MKFLIPSLVTKTAGAEPLFTAKPLFHQGPEVSGKLLDRVLAKLATELRKDLNRLAQERRLETLAQYSYFPNIYDKTFELEIHLKKKTVKGRFLVVVLPDQNPRVALFPQFSLAFQLPRNSNLKARCVEVLENYFSRGRGASLAAEYSDHVWVGEVDLNYHVPAKPPKRDKGGGRLILGGPPVQQGWVELEHVGRSLDDRFPHDLPRCLCREKPADRLERALKSESRAPQLVVGPRLVGKSALISEMVRRYRTGKKRLDRRFWLLSPQRLISGMSYLGQWEARLLAILKHAAKKDLVLVFNDLLGLFSAGVSRDSNLCVADVLKPYLQRGEVRLLAECTAEGLAILREKDRGFADLFTLTRLHETSDAETLQVTLEEIREGERVHNCQFELEAISTALDLQRRYVRDAAFPGKAATFLRKVASRQRGKKATQEDVLGYFQATSGMSLQILDDRVGLKQADVLSQLSEQVMGQGAALRAATLAIMLAKARMADPTRPIASLLFVGPTGVGKTESAKALARYLFGDELGLLRFDMNEFISPSAASRLVGTFHQPDGLLTSAVRRRPFCVLLLDEIEKAHHEVFNLLLQVLGDGRLTDARGRTVDFTQTIVILTSNLGVAEASRPIGLRSKESEEGLTYHKAVESFFPPEFFNRLDKVVPFSRLSRDDTRRLAKQLIKKVLTREGLVRRQCILDVEEQAMESIVDLGFHPQLGARALKRAIEQHISAPVSARLSEMKPHSPTVIRISKEEELSVEVTELLAAAPKLQALRPEQSGFQFLDSLDNFLLGYREECETPEGLVEEDATSHQVWYYTSLDRIRRIEAIARRLRAYLSSEHRPSRRLDESALLVRCPDHTDILLQSNLVQAMKGLQDTLPSQTEVLRLEGKFAELLSELSLLTESHQTSAVELEIPFNNATKDCAKDLSEHYAHLFEAAELGVQRRQSTNGMVFALKGALATELAASETGIHLFCRPQGLQLLRVGVKGKEQAESRVLRLYDENQGALDLRTGWTTRGQLTPSSLTQLALVSLFSVREGLL